MWYKRHQWLIIRSFWGSPIIGILVLLQQYSCIGFGTGIHCNLHGLIYSSQIWWSGSWHTLLHPSTQSSFSWKKLWKPKVPSKGALGKILTIDIFRKRWVMVIYWCCMCKPVVGWGNYESSTSLLPCCSRALEYSICFVWGPSGNVEGCGGASSKLARQVWYKRQ